MLSFCDNQQEQFSDINSGLVDMMSDKLDNFEVVCEGWLTKSPPTTRILRARWRRRYFILRHSGELPGQYFLCYYTDRNCRKVKGQIDLDQCDQVDAGLRFESGKQKYQHMFTIRTPKRIYYLAAESEDDMNKWVDCVCHVCGLKPVISDDTVIDDGDDISQATTGISEIPPPVTPSTIITGPYIPISECISGKPITSCTPPPSPGSESVFTDDESVQRKVLVLPKKPTVNWETFPRPSDSSVDDDNPCANTNSLLTLPHQLTCTNLPSPSHSTGCGAGGGGGQIVPVPPAVNRELKPGRKCSDSTCGSNEPSPTLPVFPPPNIDRKLKPAQHKKTFIEQAQVHAPNDHSQHPTSRTRGRHDKKFREIQYLDLDLDLVDNAPVCSGPVGLVKKSSENLHTPATATVYKTVDFLKTEAFNRTRIEIEEERNRLCMAESAL